MINERGVRRCRCQSQNPIRLHFVSRGRTLYHSHSSEYMMSYYKVYIYLYIYILYNKTYDDIIAYKNSH